MISYLCMSEDQKQLVQDPVIAVSQPEIGALKVPVVTPVAESLVTPTHQNFVPPVGLEIMKPVLAPDHTGLEEFEAQQTPPLVASVDGLNVVITYPDGLTDERQINDALVEKPGWRRGASHVWRRQRDRRAA